MNPTLTHVPCSKCHKEFWGTSARFAAEVETDVPPMCEKCARLSIPKAPSTIVDFILVAMLRLKERGIYSPLKEYVIVGAWELSPTRLGLKGFEARYPNSNRVICEMVKMRDKGLIERVEENRYRLSAKGAERGKVLAAGL